MPLERLPDVQEFIDEEWSSGHVLARDADLLRWQHGPPGESFAVIGATEHGRLRGMMGLIPVEAAIDGRAASGAWMTTWVAAPDTRADGLGLKLLDFVLDRYELVGALGAAEISMRIYRAYGFRTWPAVPRWVRALDPDAFERLLPGVPAPGRTGIAGAAGLELRDWTDADGAAWDAGWESGIGAGLTGTRRTAAYLDWRYRAHPTFRYAIRIAARDGVPVALLVHRVETVRDTDIRVVRIVEALGEPAALTELAGDLAVRGSREGAAFADFYCTSARPGPALAAAGFALEEPSVAALPSRFQPLEAGGPLPCALKLPNDAVAAEIYCTRSDADQDRPN